MELPGPQSLGTVFYLLVIAFVSTQPVGVSNSNFTVLYLLVLGPFPDPQADPGPGWDAAPAFIPAARLAVEQINNRSDILTGYQLELLEGDSGCNLKDRAFVNFTVNTFYNGNKIVVGIIGPGCSEATLALAPLTVREELNILQMSIATTPLINGTIREHHNTFRTVTSSLKYIDAFEEIISEQKWNRVAALYDNLREFHVATFNEFQNRIQKNGSQRLKYSSGIEEQLLPGALDDLVRNRIRVVFVFAGRGLARNVLCAAFHRNLVFPSYQWFLTDRALEDFLVDIESFHFGQETIDCTSQQMSKALNGVILSINQFRRQDQDSNNTAAGLSYTEYERLYYEKLDDYLEEINLTRSDFAATAFNYFNAYYDATWALALSLNNSVEELASRGYNLSYHYRYSRPSTKEVGDVVRSKLINLTFEGMSGTIMFDEERHEVSSIDIDLYQTLSSLNGTIIQHKVGVFGPLNISNNTILIDDEFDTIVVAISFGLGIFFIVVLLFTTVVVAILHFANIYYAKHKSVKASSPRLSHLMFSGIYLLIFSSVVFIVNDTFVRSIILTPVLYGVGCNAFVWGYTLSFSLVFGVICGKTWRIHRIFTHLKSSKIRFISDTFLISFVSVIVLIDCAILCAWSLIDPLQLFPLNTQTDGTTLIITYTCYGEHVPIWSSIVAILKVLLGSIAVCLSILTRTIRRKEFKTTLNINVLTYSLVILLSISLPFAFLRKQLYVLGFVVMNIINISFVVFICGALIVPPLWPILKHKVYQGDPSTFVTTGTYTYRQNDSYSRDSIRMRTSTLTHLIAAVHFRNSLVNRKNSTT